MRVNPFHTTSAEYPPDHRNVYHDNNQCEQGKRIKQEHRVSGTGNRKKCDFCKEL